MAIQLIDTTLGAGDSAKAGADKINENFRELYATQRGVRLVANRGGLGSSNVDVANTNSNTQVGDKLAIQLMDDVTDLSFRLGNFRGFRTGMTDLAGESAVTWRGAIYDGTLYYPVFGPSGQRDIVLAPGAIVDTMPVAFIGKKGQTVELITLKTWAAAPTNLPGNPVPGGSARDLSEAGTALTDRTLTGGFTAGQRISNFAILPPLAVMGSGPRRVCVAVLGDSIGSQGISDATTGRGEYGYMQRGLAAAGIPSITVGQAGLTLGTVVSSPRMLGQYLASCARLGITHIMLALGTNDFITGATAVTLNAGYIKVQEAARALGIKVLMVTLPPKTNAANDAQNGSETTTWAQRRIINDMLRANNGVGDGCFDLAALWQDPNNPDRWRTDFLQMTAVSIANGGTGYIAGDLVEMANGAVIKVNTVAGGVVTALQLQASAGGAFLVAPTGPIAAQNTQNFGAVYPLQPGVGLTVTATAIAAAVTTTDGVHPSLAPSAFGMQALRDQAPQLFKL